MKWQKVESSQISEVGFGEGHYGPDTIGIRFLPTKKSQASEYHYGNNLAPHPPAQTYARLVAAPSVDSWFAENIKKRPDLYPFTKVEVDPTDPATSPVSSASTTTKPSGGLINSTVSTDGETGDEPAKSTALAVFDTLADDLLFTPGAVTDAQLEAGRQWYLTEAKKYDISTEKARTKLKRFARPLQKLRTEIEARAKELTGATKRKIAAIDEEKRRLVRIVGGIEDEVLSPLTSWEQEEEKRKLRLVGIVKRLEEKADVTQYADSAALEAAIAQVEGFDISTMQECKVSAESTVIAVLKRLKPELKLRKQREAEQAELARLREEAAARSDQDRLEAAARAAREQAEREAAQREAQLVRDAHAAKERAELAEKIHIAEEQNAARRAEEAAAQAVRDQEAAVEAERKRVADEAERERKAAEARAADEKHRRRIIGEAADDLVTHAHLGRDTALVVVEAIVNKRISHITITY